MTEQMDTDHQENNLATISMPVVKQALTVPIKQPRQVLGAITNTNTRNIVTSQPLKPLRTQVQPKVQVFQDNVERRPSVGSDCGSVGKSDSFMVRDSPMIPESISSIDSSPRTSRRLAVVPILDESCLLEHVSEYAREIDQHLKDTESRLRPKSNYMRKQNDLTVSMRSILIDWLAEVTVEYKMSDETLYKAVNYIDRFLSTMAVLRGKLQLVGTAAMLLASKVEEIYAPDVNEFVFITDDTYNRNQVLRMEHLMIKVLNFEFVVVTPLDFLHRYLRAIIADKQTEQIAQFLCELTLLEYEFIRHTPSLIAAACTLQAGYIVNGTGWNDSLEFYTGYNWQTVWPVVSEIQKLHVEALASAHQTILEKYKSITLPPRIGKPSNTVSKEDSFMTDCSV